MECKNCQNQLKNEALFCNNCGAKVIDYRLSFKSVTQEFFTTFICWDNKFLKTLAHMYTKPQEVVSNYLQGVRKRYMQPFAFLIVSLTLYGILMYFLKDQMMEYMQEIMKNLPNQNSGNPELDSKIQEFNKWYYDFIMRNFNLITFISIPFLAIINLFVFYKKMNFIEHTLTLVYSYAAYMYGSIFISLIGLILGIKYQYTYYFIFVFMILYHMYFFMKFFNLSFLKTLWKTIYFWLLMGVLFLIIMAIAIIIGIVFALLTN